MGKEIKYCPHCDAKMVEYRHALSKPLLTAFTRIAEHTLPRRKYAFKNLKYLTLNARTNLYKLRYWDLIRKEPGDEKGGDWVITDRGVDFLMGHMALPTHVWSYRGEFLRYEEETKYITEILLLWKYRPDYIAEARPHNMPDDGTQGVLL